MTLDSHRNPDPSKYLGACHVIDVGSPKIGQLACELNCGNDVKTAKCCFEFVRDNIKHSADCQLNPVTCRASEVLTHQTGYCYAKSHLLCALLRANQIPAGLCYQRLALANQRPPYCLHGLNAVFLPEYGWYRIDPRGNREGIDAQFQPPKERLAFTTQAAGERDLPEIYVAPLPEVVRCLTSYTTWETVYAHLPDVGPA